MGSVSRVATTLSRPWTHPSLPVLANSDTLRNSYPVCKRVPMSVRVLVTLRKDVSGDHNGRAAEQLHRTDPSNDNQKHKSTRYGER